MCVCVCVCVHMRVQVKSILLDHAKGGLFLVSKKDKLNRLLGRCKEVWTQPFNGRCLLILILLLLAGLEEKCRAVPF